MSDCNPPEKLPLVLLGLPECGRDTPLALCFGDVQLRQQVAHRREERAEPGDEAGAAQPSHVCLPDVPPVAGSLHRHLLRDLREEAPAVVVVCPVSPRQPRSLSLASAVTVLEDGAVDSEQRGAAVGGHVPVPNALPIRGLADALP
eukprot:CAMPEP_0114631226 /NCGR_PEP_ID=MMETSP0168-20121206/14298_1 /TAXON_ID=95228 ORGANISM="Vannella sp., Strain DIVA3 517/6/12" /NCGR_SAMPLE_ID=MMETSP0168 /ASSEMBLY_ACC=CAM_ASM_000044 /LENGTH=145 /DNA_ID=CAMNT_0001842775 /DNA_START=350 /DNA_END=784 /DNA_ORIENTATION=+